MTDKSATVHCNECHKDVSTREAERCAERNECPLRDVTPLFGRTSCLTLVFVLVLCTAIVMAIIFALRLTDAQ